MHPNHHHNIHNHRITTSIPVHSSNNRLLNNTVFHNNQYTFSLNRYDDSGYLESPFQLESRPLSSASLYGDGQKISRGTKSDIGVPCRRPSTSKAILHSSGVHNRNKDKLPSVKSDFLLSYLNNNHNTTSTTTTSSNCNAYSNYKPTTNIQNQNNRNVNNNSESIDCTNSTAYHISGVSTSDYLETYKTGIKSFYTTSSNNKLEMNDYSRTNNPSHTNNTKTTTTNNTINEHQRNRIINFVNRSTDSMNLDAIPMPGSASYEFRQPRAATNVVGPLLYVDPTSDSPSNSSNHNIVDTMQNSSLKSVSK